MGGAEAAPPERGKEAAEGVAGGRVGDSVGDP